MPNQPIVTAGLVLRETVTRETDKILTVLTPDRGKISLIARGARRKNSRLAAACQLLAYSELTIYEKGQWFMLDEAETLELFTGLRTDFVALSLASYLADLTDATAQAEDTSQLLRLLLNALYALSVLHKPPQLYSFTLDTPALRQLGQAAEVYVTVQLERSFRTLDYYKSILPQEEPTYD